MIKAITTKEVEEKLKSDEVMVNGLIDFINKEILKSIEKNTNLREFLIHFNLGTIITDNVLNKIIQTYQDAGWKNITVLRNHYVSIKMNLY